jgi:hypothetical protein
VEPPVEQTDLEKARTAATTAANAAKTASDDAADDAAAAATAVTKFATIQTGGTGRQAAMDAQTYADKAKKAYEDAMKAAGDAADATELLDALKAQLAAETAQADAEKYATGADTKSTAAMTATDSELMIDDKTKSVGDSMLTINDETRTQTVNDKTTVTGHMAGMKPVREDAGGLAAGLPDLAATDDKNEYMQQVAARDIDLGFVYDSEDDAARLMLIINYVGTQKSHVYSLGTETQMGTKAGYLTIDDNNAETVDDTHNTRLQPRGMFYRAGVATGDLSETDEVADATKPEQVYSFKDPSDSNEVKFVVLTTSTTAGGITTDTYTEVDVDVLFTHTDPDPPTFMPMADIPAKRGYSHIHFGVWADLGNAADDGSQNIGGLGIGFVQNYSDEGMTETMPNHGTATFEGDWAGTVQAADRHGEGNIMLTNGAANMTANFSKGTVSAALTGLATLTGKIDGSAFDGTKATVMSTNALGLDSSGTFEGEMSGAFYGALATEAGGVFHFASEDMHEGAFSGAFGGKRGE